MLGKIFKRFRKIDDDIIIAHASPLAVPTLIGVVGDVHGCATLTGKLIDKLRDNHPDITLLFGASGNAPNPLTVPFMPAVAKNSAGKARGV